MDMTVYRRVIRELGALQFNVGTPASIAAAIMINEKLPLISYTEHQDLHTHWAIDGMKIAHAEVEAIAKRMLIDKTMTLEMCRQTWMHRCRIANDPLYILFEILSPVNYKEYSERFGGMVYHDEFVYNQAFYYIVEIMHTNRQDILNYFADFSYDKSNDVIRNRLIDRIYETFDDNLKKIPPKTMQLYHGIITEVIKDVFDLYRANYKWHRIYQLKSAPLVEDLLCTIMDGTIQDFQLTAFVNCFYDKEVREFEYTEREDKALILQINEEEVPVVATDHGIDAEAFDEAYQGYSDKYDNAVKLLNVFEQEGVCRADAIMVLGLDPIKDRAELQQYPLERSGPGGTEVQAFIFRALRSAGRGLIKLAVRFVEAILNQIVKLFGTPFGFEPKFILTEKSKLVAEWGANFNKAIHEIIEKENNVFIVAPNDVKNMVVAGLGTMISYMEELREAGESFDEAKSTAELISFHEKLNQHGLLEIVTFDRMIGAEKTFGAFIKDVVEGDTHDTEHGQAFIRLGPISSMVNSTNAKRAVQTAAAATVNQRNLTEGQINGLRSRLLDGDRYEEINERIQEAAEMANKKLKRLRQTEFDFLDKKNDQHRERIDRDEIDMCRESFKNHVDAFRDMARTINNVAQIFFIIGREAAVMDSTLKQSDSAK